MWNDTLIFAALPVDIARQVLGMTPSKVSLDRIHWFGVSIDVYSFEEAPR